MEYWYSLLSIGAISGIALLAVQLLGRQGNPEGKFVHIVSFAAGAILGDVFFHLFPELVAETGFTRQVSFMILVGMLVSFGIETLLHSFHCYEHEHKEEYRKKNLMLMNVLGDIVHNTIDGIIIGASFMMSIPTGVATAIAVVFHEIPHELGNAAVLLHTGMKKQRAMLINGGTALFSVLGLGIVVVVGNTSEHAMQYLVPFAIGNFLYIAGSDLIPEIHHHHARGVKAVGQFGAFVGGLVLMYLLLGLA